MEHIKLFFEKLRKWLIASDSEATGSCNKCQKIDVFKCCINGSAQDQSRETRSL